jgi:hypothetical protein
MMESGCFSAEEIARKNGFGNRERMRRSFVRAFAQPPQTIQRTVNRFDPITGPVDLQPKCEASWSRVAISDFKFEANSFWEPECLLVRRQFAANLGSRSAIGDSGARNHAPTANPLASKCEEEVL